MKIYDLDPDSVHEWRACSAPIVDDYRQAAGDLGHRLMLAYGKQRVSACCSAGPPGTFSKR